MNGYIIYIVVSVISLVAGLILGAIILNIVQSRRVATAKENARKIIQEAKKESESIKRESSLEAKDEALKLKNQIEKDLATRRTELQRLERRILQREENLDRKFENLDRRERGLSTREHEASRTKEKLQTLALKQREELEKVSRLSAEEAKKLLLKNVEQDLQYEIALKIKQAEEKIKEEAGLKAKKIIATAVQRYASDQVIESTVSVVPLPSDEMKGRIIGREGRNIRMLENLTGVDLIIDDTPEAVTLSSYDPIKRETARIALEKLTIDGRIHPARIEEAVEKAKKEIEERIKKEGERAILEVGLAGIHPEIVKVLGRLCFRTSFGQNVLQHSIEVAHLAGVIASELGTDIRLAKKAGLLHDLGKALDSEIEGPHALIGAKLAERYKESPQVVHAIAAHHEDEEQRTIEAVLIQACDAISATRQGARRESLEMYLKRLEKLEAVANSFEGVEKSFAIQAGREIRIMVKPEKVDDIIAKKLAHDIAKKIEDELEYPGQVKVTVIRETRVIEYAK